MQSGWLMSFRTGGDAEGSRTWPIVAGLVGAALAGLAIWYVLAAYDRAQERALAQALSEARIDCSGEASLTELAACWIDQRITAGELAVQLAAIRTQHDASRWNLGILIISGGGLALSAAGVALIYGTLRESQKATKAATAAARAADNTARHTWQIGVLQVRAYVTVGGVSLIWQRGSSWTLQFNAVNSGNSPAMNVRHEVSVRYGEKTPTAELVKVTKHSPTLAASGSDTLQHSGTKLPYWDNAHALVFWIEIVTTYRTVFESNEPMKIVSVFEGTIPASTETKLEASSVHYLKVDVAVYEVGGANPPDVTAATGSDDQTNS